MKLLNLNGPQDVMALLVRRRWWIVLPFLAFSAAVIVLTTILPEVYVSQSLVVIRPRDVPDDFVMDLIAGTTAERLSVITDRVLSDSNLRAVLVQFEDQLVDYRHLDAQEKIEKLRKQVNVSFSSGDPLKRGGQAQITSFRIWSQDHEAKVAQQITKRLTEIFIAEDRKNRAANVNETASFLQIEVDALTERLAASDAKLKVLRSKRRNELPNQLESNLRRLENLTADNQSLRRDRTNYVLALTQLEQQMSETPKRIPRPVAPAPPPPPRDLKVEDYRTVARQLRTLALNGVSDDYPDVKRLKATLQRMEMAMTSEQIALARKEDVPAPTSVDAAADPESMLPNPAYANMERQRDILRKQIEDIDLRTAENDYAIGTYNQHVNNAPQGEQELTDILRENNDLNRQHQEMSAKLSAARLSESAENQQKGSQFEIVDSASLPISPTKPAKPTIVAGGVIGSLLIGLALGLLVDILKQKTWTQSDVAHLMGMKVLVEIPRIPTRDGARRAQRKKAMFAASVGVTTIAYVAFLFAAYSNQGFVLQKLEPIIQRLY